MLGGRRRHAPFTYQQVTKDLTVESLESNIREMSSKIADKLLLNNELAGFWSGR